MRLTEQTLIPKEIKQPRYQRQQHGPGIVHLGIGAFHRAHQAYYTEQVLNHFGGDWRIIGVSLRSAAVRDQLAAQDNLYTLEVADGETRQRQLIAALANVLVAPEAPEHVIEAIASPHTHVVTLTITEKGYCLEPGTGCLNNSHPDIQHDYHHLNQPRTAIGFLASAMVQRRQQRRSGVTVISCDNISHNGDTLRQALLQFCRNLDVSLADWVDSHCRFPSSMVDRIVPAATKVAIEQLQRETGYLDQAAVFTEPFSQWVIEDNFAGPVPPWNKVGVEYVTDVTPFETMKLRLLNASHSAIAYIGAVAGYHSVDQVIATPALRHFVEQFMQQEAAQTLSLPPEYDLAAYQQQLLQRFANSALQHRCQQIAMDGSQKIPNRLLPILRWQLLHNGPIAKTTATLAVWLRYLQGVDEWGKSYAINDPLAETIAAIFDQYGMEIKSYLPAFRALEAIFPADIANVDRVFIEIEIWLEQFQQHGITRAIQIYLQE